MTQSTELHEGAIVADRYRIDAELGAGAMGTVHRAHRIADGLPVAIKIMSVDASASEEHRLRFEREAAALVELRHPNVIALVEFGAIGESMFLAMELHEGQPLDTVLELGPLDPTMAIEIGQQMLAGLGCAHERGILHRDIKPENVFLALQPDGSFVAKLLDFGLAKFTDSEHSQAQTMLTAQGTILGSPPYIPPEQIFGLMVDARSDVYSAGAVYFELLTGSWPFMREEISDLFQAHATDPVPMLTSVRADLDVRPELEAVIQKAMAKEREQRFEDANAMRSAIAAIAPPAAWFRNANS